MEQTVMPESMYDIIVKKRDGNALQYEELRYWLQGYVAGEIPDYQSAALLMAIFLNGLSLEETLDLTDLMLHSGSALNLSEIPGIKVDKHSSGGVGDKTSLVVAPLVAAAGLKMAKMSGRGLGHTGGTLDKLESIPGFQVELSQTEFIQQVKDCGLAIISQSSQLVPADKKLYALRDVTATVDSIPLIAASIMSKKLATGADVIVLDVKYGKGAFMPTPDAAIELAENMIQIGQGYGKKVAALITSMESPLGYAVGNALEVDEAIAALQGEGPEDLRLLAIALAGEIIYQAGQKAARTEAYAQAEKLLNNKKAWKQFLALVKAQHGAVDQVKTGTMTHAAFVVRMGALESGYVQSVNALEIGNAARDLGAGRFKKEDIIDHQAGVVLNKKVGDYVEKGECLATIYASDIVQATEVGSRLLQIFRIGEEQPAKERLIYGVVDAEGFIPWNALK